MKKMMAAVCLLVLMTACDKNQLQEIQAVVIEKKGCYPDSYLVEITGNTSLPQAFACPESTPIQSAYNCTNAVYIHLPADLGIPGKNILFVYGGEEISCLSATGVPPHIFVRSVRAR